MFFMAGAREIREARLTAAHVAPDPMRGNSSDLPKIMSNKRPPAEPRSAAVRGPRRERRYQSNRRTTARRRMPSSFSIL